MYIHVKYSQYSIAYNKQRMLSVDRFKKQRFKFGFRG